MLHNMSSVMRRMSSTKPSQVRQLDGLRRAPKRQRQHSAETLRRRSLQAWAEVQVANTSSNSLYIIRYLHPNTCVDQVLHLCPRVFAELESPLVSRIWHTAALLTLRDLQFHSSFPNPTCISICFYINLYRLQSDHLTTLLFSVRKEVSFATRWL